MIVTYPASVPAVRFLLVCLALSLVVGGAWAAPVSQQQALQVAQGWIRLNPSAGEPRHPLAMDKVAGAREFHNRQGQLLAYIVDLKPQGYIVVPSDDLAEPVICYDSEGHFSGALVRQDALADMLQSDIPSRWRRWTAPGVSAQALNDYRVKLVAQWQQLQAAASGPLPVGAQSSTTVVAPLLTTAWNQGGFDTNNTASGEAPYSTDLPDPEDCTGCVATAMAQIVRYWKYPTTGPTGGNYCHVDGTLEYLSMAEAAQQAGLPLAFNYSQMAVNPAVGSNYPEIAYLMACCGIANCMTWTVSESGAQGESILATAYKTNFHYASATCYVCPQNDQGANWADINSIMENDLNNGRPIQIDILDSTGGGHSIVEDGYGFSGAALYYHLNLGWGGASNAWYQALPTPFEAEEEWIALTAFVYDISPHATAAAPTVVSTTPANNASDVAVNAPLTVTFSQAMNPTTTDAAFTFAGGTFPGATGAWSTDGKTVTITWKANLSPGASYTVGFAKTATSTTGVALAAAYSWKFTTAATGSAAPTVVSTVPANNATGVAVNAPITVTFSEAMNSTTLGPAFTVTGGAFSGASGALSTNGEILTLTPSASLSPGASYTVTVATTATSTGGLPLAAAYSWTFTTAASATPPTVVSTTPANNATSVAVTTPIKVTFSEAMNQTTTADAFTAAGGTWPGASTAWSTNGKTATITPSASLAPGTSWTLAFSTAATSTTGVPLAAAYSWQFTTAAKTTSPPTVVSTTPANNATGVATNAPIMVTFNEAMNQTATQGALLMMGPAGTVSGSFGWSAAGTIMTFTPSAHLANSTVYTVYLVNSQSLGGLALATYSWKFTTAAPSVAPTVVSTTPANNATSAAVTTPIKVTFSAAMNQSTTQAALLMMGPGGTVSGSFTWATAGTIMTFTPGAPLASSTAYTVYLINAQSTAGLALATYSWKFTTKGAGAATVVSAAEAEPVADGVTLTYVLSAPADVEVTVLNIAGRLIAELSAGPQAAGLQTLRWNGRNQAGSLAPGGVYLIRLTGRSQNGSSTQAVVALNLQR
jgi:methionine-rich copper-binding protein CopC